MKKKIMILMSGVAMCCLSAMASESLPADTNGDGTVTKADATLIYDYILGTADEAVTLDDVDVNGDYKVNTADVVAVYRTIMRIGDVNVGDWNDGGVIGGGEAEELIVKRYKL